MSRKCIESDSWVDEENCEECDNSECKYSPSFKEKQTDETLSRLRSSEFAMDVTKRLTAVFPVPEDVLAKHLDSLFGILEKDVENLLTAATRDAIKIRLSQYLDAKMKSMLDDIFASAVSEQILQIEKDDKTVMTTIRDQATNKIKDYIQLQHSDRSNRCREDDPITKQIQSVVNQKVEIAIKEITTEAIEKFNKEAMKQMMRGMAKALGQDKRLLNLLTAGE